MNHSITQLAIAATGVTLVLTTFQQLPASAATFNFSVDGFTGGGMLTGTFIGEDSNGDGIIQSFASGLSREVTFYEAIWSGNSTSQPFIHRFDNPAVSFGLEYGLPSSAFAGLFFLESTIIEGEDFTTFRLIRQNTPNSGFISQSFTDVGRFGDEGLSSFSATLSPLQITETTQAAVPEPTTIAGLAMFGLGLLGLKKGDRSRQLD